MKLVHAGVGLLLTGLGLLFLRRGTISGTVEPFKTVALIGDSHSQALFPRVRPQLTAGGLRVVLEEARPGWSLSRYIADGVIERIESARPDLVIVSLGGNDRPAATANYPAMVQDFLDRLFASGVEHVVWNGPADTSIAADVSVTRAHRQVRDLLRDTLSLQDNVTWVDAFPVTGSGHRADGVHFEGPGYTRWANHLVGQVQALLG